MIKPRSIVRGVIDQVTRGGGVASLTGSPLAQKLTEPARRRLQSSIDDGTIFSDPEAVLQSVVQQEAVSLDDPDTYASTDDDQSDYGPDDGSYSSDQSSSIDPGGGGSDGDY